VPLPRLGRITLKVRLPPGLDARQVGGVVQAIERCPAYGTLVRPPSVALSVEAPALEVGGAASSR
jgi:hypothetical protein